MKKNGIIILIGMMCASTIFAETSLLKYGSTINIRVNEDRNKTIQNAFKTVLSAAGFEININGFDYLLDVNITLTPLDMPNFPNAKYVRMELNAALIDKNGKVVLPYSFSFRDGHTNLDGKENRAFREAVRKINDEYGKLFIAALNVSYSELIVSDDT